VKHHLNTLFVTTEGAYLAKDGECLAARVDGQVRLRVPITALEGVVCIGRVACSPQAMELCASNGVSLTHLTEAGRFMARLEGPVSGNVLVRRTQPRWADDPARTVDLARAFITGKLANARLVLRRGAREIAAPENRWSLSQAADRLDRLLDRLPYENDLEALRGIEGEAGRLYWAAFPALLAGGDPQMMFSGRSRRPPLDPMNAVLSFLYTLLVHDIRSSLESQGLDPQVGYLHRDRPGRPSLALDMMEEFRAVLVDRLALTLVNRGQLRAQDFRRLDSGAVAMEDTARRTVIAAWQERKRDDRRHPFLGENASLGLFWHLQALLLKRYLRGDLDGYPPCLWH
jgi:CRISPR-associated protein Cas1